MCGPSQFYQTIYTAIVRHRHRCFTGYVHPEHKLTKLTVYRTLGDREAMHRKPDSMGKQANEFRSDSICASRTVAASQHELYVLKFGPTNDPAYPIGTTNSTIDGALCQDRLSIIPPKSSRQKATSSRSCTRLNVPLAYSHSRKAKVDGHDGRHYDGD
jgi:hypothetical protein